MVLYVVKYDILPDKVEAYNEWTKSAIPRLLAGPELVEFRAYRPVTGAFQVAVTWEFADLAAWAAWRADDEVQKVMDVEGRTFCTNWSAELWGPSPIVPQPIRPGK